MLMDCPLKLGEVWAAAAVVIGFQLISFAWRLSREAELMTRHPRKENWFPIADYLNLVSMLVLVGYVFVYHPTEQSAASGLSLSLILLAGYPFAILGHYRLFVKAVPEDRPYCTPQEAVSVILTICFALWFMVSHNFYYHRPMNWLIPGIIVVAVAVFGIMGWREERRKEHKN